MKYNLIISNKMSTYNILLVDEEDLTKILKAYYEGLPSFFINGVKYIFRDLRRIKIYTFNSNEFKTSDDFYEFIRKSKGLTTSYMSLYEYIDDKVLIRFGEDVTRNFINDDFGSKKEILNVNPDVYVDIKRIEELSALNNLKFDLTKLITLCKELNIANEKEMYLTIPMLIRAIIDHVPPLFNKNNFMEICGSHGGRSFQEIMLRLEKASRKIADSYLHSHIREREVLPNTTQVNFKNELDTLLAEIVRLYK